METVDLFTKKRQICQNVPGTTGSKLKVPCKCQISTFYLNSLCVDLILPIWMKFVKNDFVYFEYKFLKFLALIIIKT